MEEQNYKTSPKISFLLGLFVGLAVIGLVGFFVTLPRAISCDIEEAKVAVIDTGIENNEVVPGNDSVKTPEPVKAAGSLSPIKETEYIKGNKNAKVTLIEFSDFECPYCVKHNDTIEKVVKEYGDQVRLVFRHFPLSFHKNAQKAAEAVECAGDQGKFWEMHDKIFEANTEKNMSVETWKETAKELALDANNFNDCLDSGKYVNKIKSDFAEGQSIGVKGTPATFINGEMVSGAMPFEKLKATIDKHLDE